MTSDTKKKVEPDVKKEADQKPAVRWQDDYYGLLGLSNNRLCTVEDIRKAYKVQVKKWHPDLNPGLPTAEARVRLICKAYEVLSNPTKRALYDKWGKDGLDEDFVGLATSWKEYGAMMLQPSSGHQGFALLPDKTEMGIAERELVKKMLAAETQARLSAETQAWFDKNGKTADIEAFYRELQRNAVMQVVGVVDLAEQDRWIDRMRAFGVHDTSEDRPFWVKFNRASQGLVEAGSQASLDLPLWTLAGDKCLLSDFHQTDRSKKGRPMVIVAGSWT